MNIAWERVIKPGIKFAVMLVSWPFWRFPVLNTMKREYVAVNSDRNGPFAMLMRWSFDHQFYKSNVAQRAALQDQFMGGDTGVTWADHYSSEPFPPDQNARYGDLKWSDVYRFVEILKDFLSRENYLFLQIGSSSGREIGYFAGLFPGSTFLGTDLYEDVCEFAASRYQLDNLDFVPCQAVDIAELIRNSAHRNVIVFSSGSLSYVFPEHVDEMFRQLSTLENIDRLILCFHEMGLTRNRPPDQVAGSLNVGNFTYSHNYRHYAGMNHIGVDERTSLIYPFITEENKRRHKDTCHYFFLSE